MKPETEIEAEARTEAETEAETGIEADRPAGRSSERWDATWADVERAQLETMLAATPAQRLAWLEEAMRLAHASGALAAARRKPVPDDQG